MNAVPIRRAHFFILSGLITAAEVLVSEDARAQPGPPTTFSGAALLVTVQTEAGEKTATVQAHPSEIMTRVLAAAEPLLPTAPPVEQVTVPAAVPPGASLQRAAFDRVVLVDGRALEGQLAATPAGNVIAMRSDGYRYWNKYGSGGGLFAPDSDADSRRSEYPLGLRYLQAIEVPMARWAAIIGARGTGKSTHASNVMQTLRDRGVRVGGYVQLGSDDELGRRSYDLHRLSNGEVMPLARPIVGEAPKGQTAFCSFAFVDAAFDVARRWLEEDRKICPVVVIDEVSKMEAGGKGHHAAIQDALEADDAKVVVLCVRADQLFYVVEKFELEDDAVGALEVPASDEDVRAFVDALASASEFRDSAD